MSTARKILSNTAYQVISKFTVALLGIISIKIATSYLGRTGYGQYSAIFEFLAFFGIIADLGLFTIAVREMSNNEKQLSKIFSNILSLRTVLLVFTMGAAVISAFFIPGFRTSPIALGVVFASLSTFLVIFNGTITSVLQVKFRMGISSMAAVISKIISVTFMAYVAFYGFPDNQSVGFYYLIVGGIIGNLVMVFITGRAVRKITPVKFRFDFDLWKKVLKNTLPYGIALILNTVYFRIDSMFILFISGEEELGLYNVAMRMLEQMTIIPLYFMNTVLPVLTKAIKEKSARYKEIIKHAFDFLAAISFPIVAGGFILAYPIIFIISGPEFLSQLSQGFYGSDIALRILIFALLFQFLNVLFAFILIAINQQNKLLYINAVCVALNLISNAIFIPQYGFRGAAATSVVSELCILIGTFIAAKYYLKFNLNLKNISKVTLSALVMGATVYYLQAPTYQLIENWNVFVLVPIGAVVYAAMLFLTKTVDRDLLRLIKKGESRPHDGDGTIPY